MANDTDNVIPFPRLAPSPDLMSDTGIHALFGDRIPKFNAETILSGLPNEIVPAHVVENFLDCKARQRVLKVGDEVAWRSGWGEGAPRLARVRRIEIDCNGLAENGVMVDECPWGEVRQRSTVVDLENGSWAYGTQIWPDMESAILRAKT